VSTDAAAELDCLRLAEGEIELLIARTVGLRLGDGPQLFASLPGVDIPRENGAPFRFHGGHRLWVAPEVPTLTYLPDDDPVEIDRRGNAVVVQGEVDAAGLRKTITLEVHGHAVVVDHRIHNAGEAPRTLAPWAITQLAVGGTAVVPLGTIDPGPFQADRSVVAWPYTRFDDPLLRLGDDQVEIEARRTDPVKLGTALQRGWLGYRREDQLFVKRAVHPQQRPLVDLGATGQCYCNDAFLELETLGALTTLAPGEAATHREIWEVHVVDPAQPLTTVAAELDLDAPSPLMGGT
jgi:hypothetical protein